MKRRKVLNFDEIMDLYDELFWNKKPVRIDPVLKTTTPDTTIKRIREAIRLSEQLSWKKRLKK